jgi:hypothetical protein
MVVGERRLRQRGFAPALTDEEVITMEICGEYFGFHTDTDIYRYFRTHYHDWFPNLRDRTTFVRQAANLWQVKLRIQRLIALLAGTMDEGIQIIDTLPLPVCVYTRSARDKCFKPYVDCGYCAAKKMLYYGFKLGLRISRLGMIVDFSLLPAPTISNFWATWWMVSQELPLVIRVSSMPSVRNNLSAKKALK